jgi:hypothetical protein
MCPGRSARSACCPVVLQASEDNLWIGRVLPNKITTKTGETIIPTLKFAFSFDISIKKNATITSTPEFV